MKIKNGMIFDQNHKMRKKDLCFENGIICDYSTEGEYDAEGCYVLPGFIDTHVHGACGVEFYSTDKFNGDYKIALDHLSREGVTSVLVTLATETEAEYLSDIERMKSANDERILGIHLEGPFMNFARKGAMQGEKLQKPNMYIPELINEKSGGQVKIVSMAPEIEGALNVIENLTKKGIKVSIAHTDASFEEAEKGVNAGATRVTHLYNAMRPFVNRDPGIIGCALTDERLNCELICDLHHVSAPAIKLAVKSKGIENITMISDTSFFCGMPEGEYMLHDRLLTVKDGFAKLADGTICCSACSLAIGAKNMFKLGFKPEEIAIMACVNPALAAGVFDRGELKTGYRADIVILDKDFNVKSVFVKGRKFL